jgi:hypothetical protein
MTGKHDAIAATDIAFIKLSMSEMAILHKLTSSLRGSIRTIFIVTIHRNHFHFVFRHVPAAILPL